MTAIGAIGWMVALAAAILALFGFLLFDSWTRGMLKDPLPPRERKIAAAMVLVPAVVAFILWSID